MEPGVDGFTGVRASLREVLAANVVHMTNRILVAATIGTAITVLCGSVAAQEELDVNTVLGFASTFVYRGLPQYSNEDTPSIQLGGDATYEYGEGVFWLEAMGSTTFWERGANSDLGSADVVDLSLGYRFRLSEDLTLSTGAGFDLRFNADPLDERKEAIVRVDWRVAGGELWALLPYTEVRGEVHRKLGAYGEVGLNANRQMGNGFTFSGCLLAAYSRYSASEDQFHYGALRAEISFQTPLPELSAFAHVTGGLVRQEISTGQAFLRKHGLMWSGFFVRYSAL